MSFSISTSDISKQFGNHVLYAGLNLTFEAPEKYALLGSNGSGKSTLMQIIMGYAHPTSGEIIYKLKGNTIESEYIYQYISFTGPYLELPEELTAIEAVELHFSLRNKITPIENTNLLSMVGLEKANNKQIKFFSSGMKQRLKLVLAFYTDSQALFLDEPCTNLDEDGTAIYQKLSSEALFNRLVIVASNQIEEYRFCNKQLLIGQ